MTPAAGASWITTGATLGGPYGVAIDPAGNKIYTANCDTGTISFANLDNTGGGGQLDNTGATLDCPEGIAIDRAANKIYTANWNNGTISYANLDDTGGGGQLDTTGATLSAPNYPVILKIPSGTGPPQISGGSTPGSVLSCSQGSWAPNLLGSFLYQAPQSYSYGWTLNGTPIAGASSSSITVGSAGQYACQVTATNHAGSSSQTSPAVTIATQTVVLSGLRVSPRRLSIAGRKVHGKCLKPTQKDNSAKHCRRPIKLKVSYTLNATDAVTFTLRRQAPGRKVKGRCVKPTHNNRKHTKCTRLVSVHGKILQRGQAGANHFTFNGKVGGHELAPGTYQLTATPAGGKPHTVTFKIVA